VSGVSTSADAQITGFHLFQVVAQGVVWYPDECGAGRWVNFGENYENNVSGDRKGALLRGPKKKEAGSFLFTSRPTIRPN